MRRSAAEALSLIARGEQVAACVAGAWRAEPPSARLPASTWASAAPLLLHTGAAGLGWWRLKHSHGGDSAVARPLADAFRLQTLYNAQLAGALGDVVGALGAVGVEPILGKGLAIGRFYAQKGLRAAGDLDLYVHPADYGRARAVVDALPDPAVVDLHAGVAPLGRGWDEVRRRSHEVTVEGQRVRVFGDEDHLRLLCLHALGHGAWRPLWLCDVAALVEAARARLDWAYLLAGDPRRADWIACTLGLAARLVRVTLDGSPVAARAARLPRWLVPAVLRQWGAGYCYREPMAAELGRPLAFAAALIRRRPNAIEASVGMNAAFDGFPRWPWQLAECCRRGGRFVRALVRTPP